MPPTPLSEAAERVNFLLGQTMRRLSSGHGKRLNMPDVTKRQLRLLRLISHSDNCAMKDLAKMADITMPAATGLVDRMVESGLVVRADDPNDRRVVRVRLTRKARSLKDKWRRLRGEKIDRVLSQLTGQDRERFVAAFETIHELMESLEKKDGEGQSAERGGG